MEKYSPDKIQSIQLTLDRLNHDLAVKEKMLINLLEKSPAGILITDLSGRLKYINSRAHEFLGPDDIETADKLFTQFTESGDSYRIDIINTDENEPGTAKLETAQIEWENSPALLFWIQNISEQENISRALIEATRKIEKSRKDRARLIFMAKRDPLTGLPNRVMFKEELKKAMKRANRQDLSIGFFIIDLDDFKLVNDTLGHNAGDELLRQVAERMSVCIREVDTLARIGGDEFFIFLENLSTPENASVVAGRIISKLSEPFIIKGREARIGSSIGICLYPDDGDNPEALVRKADIAMYQAKASGKNRYCFFTHDMDKKIQEKVTLSNQIHYALKNNEFYLLYQPQVDIKSGKIVGVEALIRWKNPERGIIPPDIFIPILEETGLINDVGKWVLKEACLTSKKWCELGLPNIIMSINFSPLQFHEKEIDRFVKNTVKETGIDTSFLEIEITEGLFMDDNTQMYDAIQKIHDMGISIVMDDFGTGFSSLSYLKRFPVDGLKIDRVFVNGILSDAGDKALVSAITGMAIGLNLNRIVAEGVEDKNQLPVLRQMGCDSFQGYLFSRPVSSDKIIEFLKMNSSVDESDKHPLKDGKRILLVEDNPVNSKLTETQLLKKGYLIDTAVNGHECVESYNCNDYELILMDIHMPEMNGYEAAVKIREIEKKNWINNGRNKHSRIPIIGLSAYMDDEFLEKSYQSGIDDFLLKPVKIDELNSMIEKWMGRDE